MGGLYCLSLLNIFAASYTLTQTFADDGELSGSRRIARKGGIGKSFVMNIVLGLTTLSLWTPSVSVTAQ